MNEALLADYTNSQRRKVMCMGSLVSKSPTSLESWWNLEWEVLSSWGGKAQDGIDFGSLHQHLLSCQNWRRRKGSSAQANLAKASSRCSEAELRCSFSGWSDGRYALYALKVSFGEGMGKNISGNKLAQLWTMVVQAMSRKAFDLSASSGIIWEMKYLAGGRYTL